MNDKLVVSNMEEAMSHAKLASIVMWAAPGILIVIIDEKIGIMLMGDEIIVTFSPWYDGAALLLLPIESVRVGGCGGGSGRGQCCAAAARRRVVQCRGR